MGSYLHLGTSGGKPAVLDDQNRVFHPKGVHNQYMDQPDLGAHFGGSTAASKRDAAINKYVEAGIKFVRCPVYWRRFEPNRPRRADADDGRLVHNWADGVFNTVFDNVDALWAAGIRTMIDLHKSPVSEIKGPNWPDWLWGPATTEAQSVDYWYNMSRDPTAQISGTPNTTLTGGLGRQPVYTPFNGYNMNDFTTTGTPDNWHYYALATEFLVHWAELSVDHPGLVGIDIFNEPSTDWIAGEAGTIRQGLASQNVKLRWLFRMASLRIWKKNPKLFTSYEMMATAAREIDATPDKPRVFELAVDMINDIDPSDATGVAGDANDGFLFPQTHYYPNHDNPITRSTADKYGVFLDRHRRYANQAGQVLMVGEHNGYSEYANQIHFVDTDGSHKGQMNHSIAPTGDTLLNHDWWQADPGGPRGWAQYMKDTGSWGVLWTGLEGLGAWTLWHPHTTPSAARETAIRVGGVYPADQLKNGTNNNFNGDKVFDDMVTGGGGGDPDPVAPSITSFSPTSAAVGATVTLTGTGFTGATKVLFGLVPATTFNVVSDTSITAVVPNSTLLTDLEGPITVITSLGVGVSITGTSVTAATWAPDLRGGKRRTVTEGGTNGDANGWPNVYGHYGFNGVGGPDPLAGTDQGEPGTRLKLITPVPYDLSDASDYYGEFTLPTGDTVPAGGTNTVERLELTSSRQGGTSGQKGHNVYTGSSALGVPANEDHFMGDNITRSRVGRRTFYGWTTYFPSNLNPDSTTGSFLICTFNTAGSTPFNVAFRAFKNADGTYKLQITVRGGTVAGGTAPRTHTWVPKDLAAIAAGASVEFELMMDWQLGSEYGGSQGEIRLWTNGVEAIGPTTGPDASNPAVGLISYTNPLANDTNGWNKLPTAFDLTGTWWNIGLYRINSTGAATDKTSVIRHSAMRVGTSRGSIRGNGLHILVSTAPTFTSLSVSSGDEGTEVEFNGTNLASTTKAEFVGPSATLILADNLTVVSDTKVRFNVPIGALDGVIKVTASGGSVNSTSFDVQVPVPTITSISQTSGPPGTVLSVFGTNFRRPTDVLLNNVSVGAQGTFWTKVSDTQIDVTIPDAGTDGVFKVVAAGGTATGTQSFDVTPALHTVTGISPTSGAVGDTIHIFGTKLGGGILSVHVGGVSATFALLTSTELTAVIPALSAGTHVVTVTKAAGEVPSPIPFVIAVAGVVATYQQVRDRA